MTSLALDLPAVLADLVTALMEQQLILIEYTHNKLVLHYFNPQTLTWDDEKETPLPSARIIRVDDHGVFFTQNNRLYQYDLTDDAVTLYPRIESVIPITVNASVYAIESFEQPSLRPRRSRGNPIFRLVERKWVRLPPTPHMYISATLAATDRYVYVAGTPTYPSDTISQYDTLTNTWFNHSVGTEMITTIFTFNTTLYCIIQRGASLITYKSVSSVWEPVAVLPRSFGSVKSVVGIKSSIYYLNMTNEMIIWYMDAQTWSDLIPTPATGHTAMLAKW